MKLFLKSCPSGAWQSLSSSSSGPSLPRFLSSSSTLLHFRFPGPGKHRAQLMFADITCSVDVFWHHLLSWCLLISLAQLMFADITCTVNHCDYFFSETSPLGKYRRFKLNIYSSFFCTTCFDSLALITCWHWLERFWANLTESEWSLSKSKFYIWPKK